jgi:hypothetical protein
MDPIPALFSEREVSESGFRCRFTAARRNANSALERLINGFTRSEYTRERLSLSISRFSRFSRAPSFD